MMIMRMFAAAAIALALVGNAQSVRAATTQVPCLGETLVIRTSDARPGSVVSVRLGDAAVRRHGRTVTVTRGSSVVLTFSLPNVTSDVQTEVKNLIAVKDICAMSHDEAGILAQLVRATVLPKLLSASGIAALSQQGYGGGFVLILVLFILLVIIGAGFG